VASGWKVCETDLIRRTRVKQTMYSNGCWKSGSTIPLLEYQARCSLVGGVGFRRLHESRRQGPETEVRSHYPAPAKFQRILQRCTSELSLRTSSYTLAIQKGR
jgi:hypothetical protein